MIEDSYWKEYNDGERAYLLSGDNNRIAFVKREDTYWDCSIYPKFLEESFYWKGIDSIEEIEHQMTLYIHNKCNKLINQFSGIRDHLPSIHELADNVK